MTNETERDVQQTERETIEEARRRTRDADTGIEPAAPSFVDETGTTYLGVEEPAVLDDEPKATERRASNATSG